jgi:GNAT superfamily N-acetyltransferase
LQYLAFDDTRVMACEDLSLREPALPAGCTLTRCSAAEYARIVGKLRGSPERQCLAHAERLLASPIPYEGWLLMRDGQVLCCGQSARELDLVGLYDVFTAEAARGQGLAGLLCSHLLLQARAQGASTAYLQVDAANTAARAVYARLGFKDGYRYHYRAKDPAAV